MSSWSTHLHPATAGHAYSPECRQKAAASQSSSLVTEAATESAAHDIAAAIITTSAAPWQVRHQNLELQVKPQFPSHPKDDTPVSRHQGDRGDEKERHFFASWKLPGKKVLTFKSILHPKARLWKMLVAFMSWDWCLKMVCPCSERQLEREPRQELTAWLPAPNTWCKQRTAAVIKQVSQTLRFDFFFRCKETTSVSFCCKALVWKFCPSVYSVQ